MATVMMLSDGDRNFLLESAVVRHYRRGHLLFEQGDDATCLFIMLAGEVEIFVKSCHGRTVIAHKEIGELLGEIELLGGQYWIASAVAVRRSLLAVIHKRAFERCISARPELCTAILRDLAVTVGEMTQRLSTLSLDTHGRLRYCLKGSAMIAPILAAVIPVLATAGIGFLWVRCGRTFETATLTPLVVDVGTPCLIFATFAKTAIPPASFAAVALASATAIGSSRWSGLPSCPWPVCGCGPFCRR